jgi:hypothetical protein
MPEPPPLTGADACNGKSVPTTSPDFEGRGIRVVRPEDAAELLGVSLQTLTVWTARFGYPRRARSPEGGSVYAYDELVALRNALMNEVSVTSAVRRAERARG